LPQISVIVPNYNHERYLEQRLNSILCQSVQDTEIIVLDDASTDCSLDVISKYLNNKQISLIVNNKNSGSPFAQWNLGVKISTGKYIWIAESDDFSDASFLHKMTKMLEHYPNAGIAFCQSMRVNENSENLIIREHTLKWLHPNRWMSNYYANGKEECRYYFPYINIIPNASAVLFRKSVFEDAGGADVSLRLNGDWMTWIKMLLISDIVFCSEPLNFHRLHKQTIRRKETTGLGLIETYIVLDNLLNKINLPRKVLKDALSIRLDKWARYLIGGYLTKNENLKIYSIARKIDEMVLFKLITKIILMKFLKLRRNIKN